MPKTVCYFLDSWLKNDQYNKWVRRTVSDTAFCQYCSRDFKVRNMGELVLKFHILSKRDKERSPLSNIASFLTPHQNQSDQKGKDSTESASKEVTSNKPAKKKQFSVNQRFVKSAKISAEIRWVLNLVTLKFGYFKIIGEPIFHFWELISHHVFKIIRLSLHFFFF